jgi:hypothetical protein
MTSSCTLIQERIVGGEALEDTEQAHVLACAACSCLAADCVALDSLVADELHGAVALPGDFADRVMRRLDAENVAESNDLFGRRWVQIALANVGIAFALINLARFVFATLIPTATLGGLP